MDASKTRATVLLGLMFVAGAAAGVAADRMELFGGESATAEAERTADRGEARGGRQTVIERFADDLGLTGPQRTEIEAILEHYRASMNGLWGEWRPRYRTLIDSVRVQIETVLTDEQVAEYRALLERRRGRGSGQTDGSDGGRSGTDRRGESGDDGNQNDDR
jgi:Spy/CpxP family protein refolding chaperone